MEKVFLTVKGILGLFGITAHGFGIYCLMKIKERNNNQRIILTNLSIIEICLMSSSFVSGLLSYNEVNNISITITIAINNFFNIAFYFLMTFISIDRLLCLLLHIKYNYFITSKVVKISMVVLWVITLPLSIPLNFKNQCVKSLCYDHLSILLGFVFLIISITAYLSIIVTVIKNEKTRVNEATVLPRRKLKKMYMVPFIVLYQTPDLILLLERSQNIIMSSVAVNSVYCCYVLGCIADALIYIFFDDKIRQFEICSISNVLRCICIQTNSSNNISPNDAQISTATM